MKTYMGIVDALGLESFVEYDSKPTQEAEKHLQFLKLRAQCNQQRNAIVYKIKLSKETIEVIKGLMKKGLFVKAGYVVTRYLDSANKTKLTEINKHLQEVYKLRGYL